MGFFLHAMTLNHTICLQAKGIHGGAALHNNDSDMKYYILHLWHIIQWNQDVLNLLRRLQKPSGATNLFNFITSKIDN